MPEPTAAAADPADHPHPPALWLISELLGGQVDEIEQALNLFHPSTLADAMEGLPRSERQLVWDNTPKVLKGELLLEVHRDVRAQLIETTPDVDLVTALDDLQPDELADLEPDLPPAIMTQLLHGMDAEDRQAFALVRSHEPDTAGGLMDVDAIVVRSDMNVAAVLRYLRRLRLRRGSLPEHCDSLMVVDRDRKLLGSLSMADLTSVDTSTGIADLMTQPIRAVAVDTPAPEVARLFEDRDLISAPVVDTDGRLIGRITIDDVVDVIRAEADRALLRQAGLHEEVDLFAPVVTSIQRRAGWLGVHLLAAFLAAGVIWVFEASIEEVVALAVLMPVIASMAGVSGNQTLTLVTRGIALAQLSTPNTNRLLLLECRVALWNGLIWAVVVALAAGLWFADPALGVVFGTALAISMLGGAIAGTLVPVIMTRMNIDPAIAGGVVLTGITDVIGFGSFLGLAAWLLI